MRKMLTLGAFALLALGCDDEKGNKPEVAPKRFDAPETASAQAGVTKKALESFCEVTYPASGAGAKRWVTPPERKVPASKSGKEFEVPKVSGGWTWVNLWASWCQPCVAEIPLLVRWQSTLGKEGIPVRFQMWSVDSQADDLVKALDRQFPGEVRWLRSEEDLGGLFDQLGIDKSSAIPVHALVDPAGNLRCVRVGSVGEGSYGTIKTLVSGS